MSEEEVIDELIKRLKPYVYGRGGGFSQEPYRGEYFRIFARAYNAGLGLKADRLMDLLAERWPIEPYDEDKYAEVRETLYRAWSEWTYAWDHARMRTEGP